MLKRLLLLSVLIPLAFWSYGQAEGWSLFAKTKFETKYNEKAAEYFLTPNFPAELKSMVGKEVDLEGYYLPIDVVNILDTSDPPIPELPHPCIPEIV